MSPHPKYPPDLVTDRLLLRPFTMADARRVQRMAGDRAIASVTLNIPHPYEDGLAEDWIGSHPEKHQSGESAVFAITLKDRRLLIGAIGLTFNDRFNRAEMGYWIGVEFWGQGYCTEAARAVLRYAFEERGLEKVTATHLARNPASGRVMQKIGMTREGYLRHHVIKWDVYEDLVAYGMLRDEWEETTAGSSTR